MSERGEKRKGSWTLFTEKSYGHTYTRCYINIGYHIFGMSGKDYSPSRPVRAFASCSLLGESKRFSCFLAFLLRGGLSLMGFFSSILGTLKEFMAVTAMLYHKLFLGFESLHLLERVISPNGLFFFPVTFIDQDTLPAPFSSLWSAWWISVFLFIGFYESFFTFSCLVCLFLFRLWPFSSFLDSACKRSFWQISFWVSLFCILLFACS